MSPLISAVTRAFSGSVFAGIVKHERGRYQENSPRSLLSMYNKQTLLPFKAIVIIRSPRAVFSWHPLRKRESLTSWLSDVLLCSLHLAL